MTTSWLKNKLVESMQKELPGWEAQKLLSPGYNPAYRRAKPDAKEASVMALISDIDTVPHLCFIKRASHYEKDKHKGQISFAGGKIEEGESKLQAVVREVEEEIGIPQDQYEIIGELSSLYIFVSNFVVYPFVAFAKNELQFKPDPSEVESIIQWPITSLMEGTKITDINIRSGVIKNVPYYPLQDEVLWGATSMMTSELLFMIQ